MYAVRSKGNVRIRFAIEYAYYRTCIEAVFVGSLRSLIIIIIIIIIIS
jgi:hypothetical protein